MAAGEDQAETVVGNFIGIIIRLFDGPAQPGGGVSFQFFFEPRAAADSVYRLVPGGLDDPGARVLRHPRGRPLADGSRKCLLRGLFSQVEIAHQPDEGSDDSAPIGAIDRVNSRVYIHEAHMMIENVYWSCRSGNTPFDLPLEADIHMKYMLLIYGDEKAIDEAEREHCYVESTQLAHDLKSNGQFLATSPLQPTSMATCVRVRDGKRLVKI